VATSLLNLYECRKIKSFIGENKISHSACFLDTVTGHRRMRFKTEIYFSGAKCMELR